MGTELLRVARETVESLRNGRIGGQQASRQLREQQALLGALPPRFAEVLHALLDRLESSALFEGESCSFSQRELHDHLDSWLAQAERRLVQAPPGAAAG